jgi:hypothetical protein
VRTTDGLSVKLSCVFECLRLDIRHKGACHRDVTDITFVDMSVAYTSPPAPWLLLVFSLPVKSASQRVEVWRKLQRYGMLALRSSGYVLPHSAINQERMKWLAMAIRTYKGQASVVQAQGSMSCRQNS